MTFTVTVRTWDKQEVGPLDGYLALELDLRLMAAGDDLGLGEVTIPADHRSIDLALADGAGVVVRRTGSSTVVASGDIEQVTIDDSPSGVAVLSFTPDDSLLADEIAYPVTTVDSSTTATGTWPAAEDVRTGPAETVLLAYLAANVGPAAGITRRRYAWLTIPTSLGRGPTGTWRARFDTLLDLSRRIAVPSGLALRVAQAPAGGSLTVEVWQPATIPDVRLSPESGTVTGVLLQTMPRAVDEVVVVAGGEDEARVTTRRTAAGYVAGRRRRVRLVDQRQTADLAEMRQAADEQIADGAATAGATFAVVERDGMPRFGVDWRLGDIITAATHRRVPVTDAVQAVQVSHQPGGDPVVRPVIGVVESSTPSAVAQVRRLIHPLLRR